MRSSQRQTEIMSTTSRALNFNIRAVVTLAVLVLVLAAPSFVRAASSADTAFGVGAIHVYDAHVMATTSVVKSSARVPRVNGPVRVADQPQRSSRQANEILGDEDAAALDAGEDGLDGSFSTFTRDTEGNITKYTTYGPSTPEDPEPFRPTLRYDQAGEAALQGDRRICPHTPRSRPRYAWWRTHSPADRDSVGDMTDLQWLAQWYHRHIDGDWEHTYGVTITTLDNPGWSLQVDLEGTALRDVIFEPEESELGEQWSRFWKDDVKGRFHAAGDPTALPRMIERFRAWAEASAPDAK